MEGNRKCPNAAANRGELSFFGGTFNGEVMQGYKIMAWEG